MSLSSCLQLLCSSCLYAFWGIRLRKHTASQLHKYSSQTESNLMTSSTTLIRMPVETAESPSPFRAAVDHLEDPPESLAQAQHLQLCQRPLRLPLAVAWAANGRTSDPQDSASCFVDWFWLVQGSFMFFLGPVAMPKVDRTEVPNAQVASPRSRCGRCLGSAICQHVITDSLMSWASMNTGCEILTEFS